MAVVDIKKEDLQNYKKLRERRGLKLAPNDKELVHSDAVAAEAFNNDKTAGQDMKALNLLTKT